MLLEAAHSTATAVAALVSEPPPYPTRLATKAANPTLLAQFCSPTDEATGVKRLNLFTLKPATPH